MMALHQVKLSVASLLLGVICFYRCFHDANGFFVPTTAMANTLRGMPLDSAFATTVTAITHNYNRQTSRTHMMPIDIDLASFADSMTSSSFHMSAIEVFDGSSIVDPVVVSSSFWSSLRSQFLSVILGQFIASVVFAILASFLAPQLSSLRNTVLSKFTNNDNNRQMPTKPFIRVDSIARPAPDFGKLLICLLIDIIGASSEALPIVGEFTDILTAPAAALILQNLYPESSKFVFLFEFAEEILPLTDFIPFATICWVVDTYYPESSIADVFQLGNYNGSAVTTAEKLDSFNTSAENTRSRTSDNNTKR